MEDLTRDGIPEYIFVDGNELDIVKQNGKRLFSYKVKEHISDRPDIYKFSASDKKVGINGSRQEQNIPDQFGWQPV